MPSKAFTLSKTRLATKQLANTLRGSFSAQPDVKSAAVLGNGLVAVGGTLYDSTVDGSEVGKAVSVINVGRPAAAIYAPASGGVAMVGTSGGGSVTSGGGGSFSGLTGTISDAQAPQFLKTTGERPLTGNMAFTDLVTIDGMDPSVHIADPDAHHPRLHDIFSTSDHSYSGASALDVFGFNGTALGWLTPSANPGVNSRLLKSNDTGNLALTSLTTPLINTASGNLTIDPVGDVLFPNAQIVRTETFSSSFPIGGFELYPTAIAGQSGLTIGVIEADELRVRIFVANETRVDRGEKYDSKSFGITSEPFTTPSSIGGTVTIYFEDSPAISGAIFSNNDWLLFRDVDIDTGLSVVNVWGQVSGYTNETGNYQSWTFTLRQGATSHDIGKSSFATDWGASGQGLIHYSAVDPTGSPYIEFLSWTGSDPYSPANWTTHVRIGKLVTSLNNDLLPTGYGLYGDNAFLAGDFLTAGGYIRMYQASGINIQEDVWGSWDNKRALQWWPDVSSMTGSPSFAIYTGKVNGGLTDDQNFAYIDSNPTGGQAAALTLSATHQGSASDAAILLQGGSSALTTGSNITAVADSISLVGPLSANAIVTDGILPSNTNTPNDIGANANRFDTIYADNIVANTLTASLSVGSTLSGAIWQNDASNMTIESDSGSDRVLFITNAGAGSMSINVDNDIIVGGNVDGVDVSAFKTAYDSHSHSHSTLSNLTADDHVNYVHISTNRTITAQHTFGPATARAPFILSANAQSQLVTGLRADQLSKQVIAGSGLSGTGTLTSDVTLAIAWGAPTISTITPDAAANAGTATTAARSDHVHAIVAAAPATNISVSTTKTEGTATSFLRSDATFAITSSSNPGAAASLLASTSAGGLTLQTLTLAGSGLVLSSTNGTLSMADDLDTVHKLGRTAIGSSVYSDFAAFSHRDMSAAGQYGVLQDQNGLLFLNTTTGHTISHRVNNNDVMVMTSERLNPAGSTQIDLGDYNRKWRTLYAAELYVEVLVAQSVMATIGGRIMVAPTTKLIADINGYQMYIDVKDNDLFNGDYLRLETAPGGVPQVEEMRVVSTPTTITGGFRYNVLRRVNDTTGIVTIASMNNSQTTIDVNASFIGNPTYFYLNIAGSPLSEVIQVNSAPTTIAGGYRYNCVRNVTGTGAQTWASGAKVVFTYLSWLSGDAVVSLAGGSAPITTLIAALTNVATTMDVGSSGLVSGVSYFLQKSTQYEVVTVTSAATAVTGGYRYTITRNVNGGGAKSWALADSIMDTRQQTGRGYIDLTSTSTVHNHLGPTIAIYSRTGTTNWNDVKAVVSFGNLRSFVDYTADTFGWAVGNDLTLSPTGGFSGMTGDAVNGLRLFNTINRMYVGGTEKLRIDPTNGIDLALGNDAINALSWKNAIGDASSIAKIWSYSSGSVSSTEWRVQSSSVAAFSSIMQYVDTGPITAIQLNSQRTDTGASFTTVIDPTGTTLGHLRVTEVWSGYPDSHTDSSEIANDTGTFKQLMVVGNKSNGGSNRRVGLWDQVQIGGAAFSQTLNVNGGVLVSGTGLLHVTAASSATAVNADSVRLGIVSGTPRLMLEDNTYGVWQLGHGAGILNFIAPDGATRFVVNSDGSISNSSGSWFFGTYTSTPQTSTGYVSVTINGTSYKLLAHT